MPILELVAKVRNAYNTAKAGNYIGQPRKDLSSLAEEKTEADVVKKIMSIAPNYEKKSTTTRNLLYILNELCLLIQKENATSKDFENAKGLIDQWKQAINSKYAPSAISRSFSYLIRGKAETPFDSVFKDIDAEFDRIKFVKLPKDGKAADAPAVPVQPLKPAAAHATGAVADVKTTTVGSTPLAQQAGSSDAAQATIPILSQAQSGAKAPSAEDMQQLQTRNAELEREVARLKEESGKLRKELIAALKQASHLRISKMANLDKDFMDKKVECVAKLTQALTHTDSTASRYRAMKDVIDNFNHFENLFRKNLFSDAKAEPLPDFGIEKAKLDSAFSLLDTVYSKNTGQDTLQKMRDPKCYRRGTVECAVSEYFEVIDDMLKFFQPKQDRDNPDLAYFEFMTFHKRLGEFDRRYWESLIEARPSVGLAHTTFGVALQKNRTGDAKAQDGAAPAPGVGNRLQ